MSEIEEINKIDFTKNSQSIYFKTADLKKMKSVCTTVTGREEKDLSGMKEFIMLTVDTALGETKHLEKDNAKLQKEIDNLLSVNMQLKDNIIEFEKKNSELVNKYEDLSANEQTVKEYYSAQEQIIKQLLQDNSDLKDKALIFETENSQLTETINSFQTELSEKQNKLQNTEKDIVLHFSGLQKDIIERYINDTKTIEFVKNKFNKNGEFDGLFDVIDTDNEKTNIANFCKVVVFANIYNGTMPNNILTKKQINTAFEKRKNQ